MPIRPHKSRSRRKDVVFLDVSTLSSSSPNVVKARRKRRRPHHVLIPRLRDVIVLSRDTNEIKNKYSCTRFVRLLLARSSEDHRSSGPGSIVSRSFSRGFEFASLSFKHVGFFLAREKSSSTLGVSRTGELINKNRPKVSPSTLFFKKFWKKKRERIFCTPQSLNALHESQKREET